MSAGHIINTEMSTWNIVDQNVANVNLGYCSANAVPDVHDLTTHPLTKSDLSHFFKLGFRWSDAYIMRGDADLTLEVHWSYGVRYRGGGAYIQNAWIDNLYNGLASHGAVGDDPWWLVDLRAEVDPPYNGGTDTAPLAVLPLTIIGEVRFGHHVDPIRWRIFLYGNGHEEHVDLSGADF
jgi:hypothetical protein